LAIFVKKLADFMLTKNTPTGQLNFLMPGLRDQLRSKHPIYILAGKINWQIFEDAFSGLYSADFGSPAKPIRLMVSLLILKHLRDVSDESIVEQWEENAYYQYFGGMGVFTPGPPCAASELVHFRNRIGENGIELIFKESIRVNGKDGQEQDITADTTVQEKNITFPTDSKLHVKIINKCIGIAEREGVKLRQTYTFTVKDLRQAGRFRSHPKNRKKALAADRKLKTIAGRLVRELERKLSEHTLAFHRRKIDLFKKILEQSKDSKNKIYSIHEPHVQCISKGKDHKKYEFGSKVSVLVTQNTGVIVGALNMEGNPYDGHTLEPALGQYKKIQGKMPRSVTADKGYRGVNKIEETQIHIPKPPSKQATKYQKQKARKRFGRRAAVEPVISHLKQDYRLSRNYYSGIKGDNINVMLSAAAMNFKRMINIWTENPDSFLAFLKYTLIQLSYKFYFPQSRSAIVRSNRSWAFDLNIANLTF
jgi:IS5 family transposase